MDFVQITSHQFGQLVQLFSDVEIQDLKFNLGLKILYIHYIIQPKKQQTVPNNHEDCDDNRDDDGGPQRE